MGKRYNLQQVGGLEYPTAKDFSDSDAGIREECRLATEDLRIRKRQVSLGEARDLAKLLSPELCSG